EKSYTTPDPSSTVPFRRDPDFVDRPNILAWIREKCLTQASSAALVGLGGVGKSQLIIEYAYRIREEFPQTWVFWVHASNRARFEEGYKAIADRLEIPGRDELKLDILQLVSNWLYSADNCHWIMILDSADDASIFFDQPQERLATRSSDWSGLPAPLTKFLPQTQNGSILITTRNKDVAFRLTGSHENIIKVEPMDEVHALTLFRKKLAGGFNEHSAMELLHALDYMPLAITQAAAFINQMAPRITVQKYLNSFRKSDKNKENFLNRDAGDLRRDGSASNSIITTWQMSFEHIHESRPSAAGLLSLMSFFDQQGIPEFLLHGSKEDVNGNMDFGDDIDLDFEDDVATLTRYCLISTSADGNSFEMHPLVQFSTKKWLESYGDLEKWRKEYIAILSGSFPIGDFKNWSMCRTLFPHAETALSQRPVGDDSLRDWAVLLTNTAWYAWTKGSYLMAETMVEKALDAREAVLGMDHPDTLRSVSVMALILQFQGKHRAAEEMIRRVLEGREKVLGEDHPETITIGSILALVLRHQGKYEAAEEMNQRSLEGYKKILGDSHSALACISARARAVDEEGEDKVVEGVNQQALDKRVQDDGYPFARTSDNNLALMLQYQGKYEAVGGTGEMPGKDRPSTLTSISNLALVLQC
ncbi:P-loop containing nucleoside triphosphate hydrolase protein, partial [Bisporella sp. PMI_857]